MRKRLALVVCAVMLTFWTSGSSSAGTLPKECDQIIDMFADLCELPREEIQALFEVMLEGMDGQICTMLAEEFAKEVDTMTAEDKKQLCQELKAEMEGSEKPKNEVQSAYSEALILITKVAEGAVVYFYMDQYTETGEPTSNDQKTFPRTDEPAVTHTEIPEGAAVKPDADFSEDVWQNLSFAQSDPSRYRVTYSMGGVGKSAWCEVLAEGDLDGDGETSAFKIRCQGDDKGEASCSEIEETNPEE